MGTWPGLSAPEAMGTALRRVGAHLLRGQRRIGQPNSGQLQQFSRLRRSESQVGGTNLGELALHPQPVQTDPQVGSRSSRRTGTSAARPARSFPAIHDRNKTVFPEPGGADTTVTREAPRRSKSSGRATSPTTSSRELPSEVEESPDRTVRIIAQRCPTTSREPHCANGNDLTRGGNAVRPTSPAVDELSRP
ncbi:MULTISPECIES: hypothetical protein [unclassified Nocardia]|uniref:hypothetical protein n=1 Tax=unclassified Nocardia TaxID=2637762 RepID=UPI001CE4B529|nr:MULTISPECIES: hypothetical protein [unclassified Nocardia]